MRAPRRESDRKCEIEGCGRPHVARGLCARHHRAWCRHGDPLGRSVRPSAEERFWSKVDKTESCWIWTGGVGDKGYGQFHIAGRTLPAHRVAYEYVVGSADGWLIDHACHNRRCVRPDPEHCRLVTNKQNMENRRGPNSNGSVGVMGVTWRPKRKRWVGRVYHNRKCHFVGSFTNLEDADAAVTAKRLELFTHNDGDRRKVAAQE